MKKTIFLLSVMFVMALAVTACGKESDMEVSTSVGNVVDIGDIVEEIPTEDVTDADRTNDNSEPEQAGTSDTENDVENANQQPVETKTEPSKEQSEQQLVQQSQEPTEQAVPTATLNGKITSVGNGEFVIRKANVISSDVMISGGERAETVSVTYTENTEFELCTSSDGGITADYSVASSSALVSDCLVEIKGAYEGNSFMAQKVTIYSFNK